MQDSLFRAHAIGHVERHRNAGIAAVVAQRPRLDGHLDYASIGRDVTAGIVRRLHALMLAELVANLPGFLGRAQAFDIHRQHLLATVAVVPAGRGIDGQKFERIDVGHPHRQRILLEQQAERSFATPQIGDVLMRRHPATIRHRPVANPENAAICQFDDGVVLLLADDKLIAPGEVFVHGHRGMASRLKPQGDDLLEEHAGSDAVRRQIVHVDVAAVADDQPLLAVEEAKPLRHVVERRIETVGDLARLGLFRKRCDLGVSRPLAFAGKTRSRSDEIHQVGVVGVDHPDQQHHQHAKIDADADVQWLRPRSAAAARSERPKSAA